MILVDFFSEECCKGTEMVEGWYWYDDDWEDDGKGLAGPFDDEEDAIYASQEKIYSKPDENYIFANK